MFAWTYMDLKGIPLKLVQHRIELDTSIPPAHQARYRLNLNYATVVKQNIDNLFVARFIQPVKEVTWLFFILVMFKKNGKLRICVDFRKLNRALTKKDPDPLPFFDEVLNIVTWYEAYSFLDKYSRYHQIPLKIDTKKNYNRLGSFCLDGDAIWCQKWASNFRENN